MSNHYIDLPRRLYHVTFGNRDKLPKIFTPRIPRAILDNEEQDTPRICLSTSIINCLMGIGYRRVEDKMDELWDDDRGARTTVISWETDKLNQSMLITPEQLNKEGLVDDAYFTREYWYLGNLSIDDAEVTEVDITNIAYEDSHEYVLPFERRRKLIGLSGGEYEEVEEMLDMGEDVLEIIPIREITYFLTNDSTNKKYVITPTNPDLPQFNKLNTTIKPLTFGNR